MYKNRYTDIISFGMIYPGNDRLNSYKINQVFAPSGTYYKLIYSIGPFIVRRFYKNNFIKNTILKLKKEDVQYNFIFLDDWLIDFFVYKYSKK